MRSTSLVFFLALLGCSGTTEKDGSNDDTDTSGNIDDPVYDPGCITVDGGGGYAKLADAVTVASEGAIIELCDGTYEESVVVEKSVTIRGASPAA